MKQLTTQRSWGKVLQAEETAKGKALRLELVFMGAAGQRPMWLKLVGKEESGKIKLYNKLCVILSYPPSHTHTHIRGENQT